MVFKDKKTNYSYVFLGPGVELCLGKEREEESDVRTEKNRQKRIRLIEEDRYNAELELSIEEKKENKVYQSTFEDDEGKQFDLAVKNNLANKLCSILVVIL